MVFFHFVSHSINYSSNQSYLHSGILQYLVKQLLEFCIILFSHVSEFIPRIDICNHCIRLHVDLHGGRHSILRITKLTLQLTRCLSA